MLAYLIPDDGNEKAIGGTRLANDRRLTTRLVVEKDDKSEVGVPIKPLAGTQFLAELTTL